jgi:short-subunit dehydrogenase
LVNNAGVIQMGPVEDQSLEDFEEALGTMFYGVLMPIWSVLPQMISRGEGRIVNITSIGGKLSVPHLLPYNCAKFAAVGLSEGLRAELGRSKISVTTIVPGLMRTG